MAFKRIVILPEFLISRHQDLMRSRICRSADARMLTQIALLLWARTPSKQEEGWKLFRQPRLQLKYMVTSTRRFKPFLERYFSLDFFPILGRSSTVRKYNNKNNLRAEEKFLN